MVLSLYPLVPVKPFISLFLSFYLFLFQATLHKGILHMAGQLGLDPPTMNLCSGGPTVELEQALINSDAVAKCFNCSVSNAAIIFVIYCSTRIPPSERIGVQDKLDTVLKQMRLFQENKGCLSNVLYPI